MLRDVLKKVKKELGDGRREREEMEESILVLIERICDKAMETQKEWLITQIYLYQSFN